MPVYPFGIAFRDARGFLYYERFYTQAADPATAAGQATAFFALIFPLSNADAEKGTGVLLLPTYPASRGSTDPYSSGTVKLVLVFQDAYGDAHRFQLPSPKAALFLADGLTLDQTQTPFVNFLAGIAANNIVSRDGVGLITFLGGFRKIGKQKRKLTQDVLAPSLANQG